MANNNQFDFNLGNSSGNAERGVFIPTKILQQDLLSGTSEAWECFVQQKCSSELQSFLVSYVISISGLHPVYA